MNCFNMSKVFSRATKWRSLDDKEYNLTSELKMVYGYRFTEYNKAKGSYKEPVSSVCYELAVSNKNVLACENMLYHMGLLDIDNGRYIVRSLSHLKGVLVKKKNK